ncbi:class I SAM-dependent methyltransferase [Candidatus Roizmanbacteria bacterium]|nr:class I SAM-dependent methyltransferase [Candidatus Roizmanbacteria bacterium]
MLKQLENILKSEIDPAFAKRAEFIFQAIEVEKPKKVLDAGCGRGFYLQALSLFPFIKEIHGIDINEKYLQIARSSTSRHSGPLQDYSLSRIVFQNASIYSLPYTNKYFDFIICSEVLEHLKNDAEALRELKRVLKPSGTLIITVPNHNFPFLWDPLNWILMKLFNTHINKNIWWLAGIWADHERLYLSKEIKLLAKESGFSIAEMRGYVHWCWPFSHFILYGIGKNLVEKFGLADFSRFNLQTRKKNAELIADFFRLPSTILKKQTRNSPSVNLLILLRKIQID